MRGTSLLELVAVLALLAIAATAILPGAGRLRDRAAVLAAREAVAGLIAEARIAAVVHGGADVVVADAPWRAWYMTADTMRRTVSLEPELDVRVVLSRARSRTEIRLDALGLGRVASETLRFTRGAQEAGLVVSAYGRVRRW